MEENKEVIKKRIEQLENFLKTKPERQVYMGDGDNAEEWIEMENIQNDRIEKNVKEEIGRLKRLLFKLTTK